MDNTNNNNRNDMKRKVLLAGIIVSASLALIAFLGNPGLLAPSNDNNDRLLAEAADSDGNGSGDNNDEENSSNSTENSSITLINNDELSSNNNPVQNDTLQQAQTLTANLDEGNDGSNDNDNNDNDNSSNDDNDSTPEQQDNSNRPGGGNKDGNLYRPVAYDGSASTNEDTPVNIKLIGGDNDGNKLEFVLVAGPSNGSLDGFDSEEGEVTYIPSADYYGQDSFTFKVGDGKYESDNIATVLITVNPVVDIYMEDSTRTHGLPVYSDKQLYAEYFMANSSVVGKKIDTIVLELAKSGNPEGTAEIGIFNPDLSVKKLFGTIDVSTISEEHEQYTFVLPSSDEPYEIGVLDKVGIKFDGGDEFNYISIMVDEDPEDPFDGTNSHLIFYPNTWWDLPNSDLWMTLANSR